MSYKHFRNHFLAYYIFSLRKTGSFNKAVYIAINLGFSSKLPKINVVLLVNQLPKIMCSI